MDIRDHGQTSHASRVPQLEIYYSGATPGQVLRLMSHMRVACISNRTFYLHQHQYLEPSIVSVWNKEQSRLLAQSRAHSTSLSIGGDGRADSPGHSAKYGSYGIIDLNTNKVLHIELVQVNNISDLCLQMILCTCIEQ